MDGHYIIAVKIRTQQNLQVAWSSKETTTSGNQGSPCTSGTQAG